MAIWEEGGDGSAPFDDDDLGGVRELFVEVGSHDAGVGKAIKIIMSEGVAISAGVRFGDGEAGASDVLRDAEAGGEATSESSLAGADIAD